MVINIPQTTFNPENSQNPIDFIASSEWMINLDPKIKQDRTVYFKSVDIYDDRYDFIP